MKAQGVKAWLKMLAPVLASILGLVALRLLGPDVVNQQDLQRWLVPLGRWAPLAFILFLAVRPITLLPGQLFTAVGGMLFGTAAGTVYALLGSLLANALVFFLGKRFGKRLMRRVAGERYQALKGVARRHGFRFALLTCINPLLPSDVMIAVASASGARALPTLLGMLIGTVPGTFLTAQFGSGLAQGRTIMTLVSAVGMVVSLVLGTLLGRRIYLELADVPEPPARPAEPPAPPRASATARQPAPIAP